MSPISTTISFLSAFIKKNFIHKLRYFLLLLLLGLIVSSQSFAQTDTTDNEVPNNLVFDEIQVSVLVESYGSITINTIYTEDNLLYINIEELFKKLKINCDVSLTGDSVQGFFDNVEKRYLLDYNKKQISTNNKKINAKKGLLKETGIIYIESSLLATFFDLSLTFNFRSLSGNLKANFELPVLKEMRLEKLHNGVSKTKTEIKPDTTIGRKYHLLKFGNADWSFTTSQNWKSNTINRVTFGVGAELLFGEATVSYNYNSQYKFNNRQLNYLWHWIDNSKKLIKQAEIGKISTNMIAYIKAPIVGAAIRNTPTTVRKASGFYTLNESTEPNWNVELYINNELVDYTKADASGRFLFKVPIVYGSTTLKLKYYGPLGEERTEERTFNTAFTLMPSKEFEYGLSAGVVQDSVSSRMGKADFNYGLNRNITLGGGLEYLSSIANSPAIPFAKITYQPFSKLVLTYEYAHGVKTHALLNYYFIKNAFIEIDYSNYKEGQKANPLFIADVLKAKLSLPLKYKMVSGYANLNFSKTINKGFSYNQTNFVLSGYYKQYSFNSTTEINWAPQKTNYTSFARTTLALSARLNKGINIRPSTIYNLSQQKFTQFNTEIEKRIKNGFITIIYQKDMSFNNYSLSFNLKYDLRFFKTQISSILSKKSFTTSQSAQGSLSMGSGNNYIHASNISSTGKGGITLYPFLDLNQNGIFDKGEHLLKLSSLKIMSSTIIYNEKDSIIRIPGLYAFTNYALQFNDKDLENISWRFSKHSYSVQIDPNQFKRIDIPVIVMGEVNGMVYLNTNNALKGIGRILVNIYDKNSQIKITEIQSESDGYIQYLGLKPGTYTAKLDSIQLSKLGLSATPSQLHFSVKSNEQGDIIQMENFILKKEDLNTISADSKK